jgi:ABC-type dipeptide/oligopeptide/nickel transport system ATPase component
VSGCPYQARCPRVEARCLSEAPALVTLGAGAADRQVRCYFPLDRPK